MELNIKILPLLLLVVFTIIMIGVWVLGIEIIYSAAIWGG
jgi:hypothetical protein